MDQLFPLLLMAGSTKNKQCFTFLLTLHHLAFSSKAENVHSDSELFLSAEPRTKWGQQKMQND